MEFKIGDKFTGTYPPEAAIWCNANNAMIVKLDSDEYEIVAIPEPTEEEINQARIAELKHLLADSDWAIVKIAEGSATHEQYAELIEQRKAWREEINALEG